MSSSWNVLLPREIDPTGPSAIADFADCTGMDEYDSIDDALADVDRYDAIIVRVAKLDRDVIERADRLRVIAKHGAGLDNVDIDAASEHNIVVCNTPGVNARSVAEHAIALLFGIQRNLHTADRHIRDGGWNRAAFRGRELRDTTLGLMGFGSIAKETAQLAEGVGMDVIVYDPHRTHVRDGVVRLGDLTELFERADAVSLHVPLTDETRGGGLDRTVGCARLRWRAHQHRSRWRRRRTRAGRRTRVGYHCGCCTRHVHRRTGGTQ